jgi:hypothetical protein
MLVKAWRWATEANSLLAARRWLRSLILRWLGYETQDVPCVPMGGESYAHIGSVAYVVRSLRGHAPHWLPAGTLVEVVHRNVLEVPSGTVRFVVEEHGE